MTWLNLTTHCNTLSAQLNDLLPDPFAAADNSKHTIHYITQAFAFFTQDGLEVLMRL